MSSSSLPRRKFIRGAAALGAGSALALPGRAHPAWA
ncbi:MAG: twin-arginine translocation signal domain-containing protein [Alphaproteobacteria bacterium]|nr:MAG: twin-arginine translocation signal domain-containing protein [Alphaproteobacteria bacterium]